MEERRGLKESRARATAPKRGAHCEESGGGTKVQGKLDNGGRTLAQREGDQQPSTKRGVRWGPRQEGPNEA